MARGRKPIQRTKEEAQNARREQVRRNVQAFRRRNNAPKVGSVSDSDRGKHWTFTEDSLPPTARNTQHEKNSEKAPRPGRGQGKHISLIDVDSQPSPLAPLCPNELYAADSERILSFGPREAELSKPLPPEIDSAIVSRQQFVANSVQIFLPDYVKQSARSDATGPHWVYTLPTLVNADDILDSSVQALCLLQIAQAKQETRLHQASRYYYGRALQRLNLALSHPHGTFRKEVFASSLILAVYELFNGTTKDHDIGRKLHLQGAASYLTRLPSYDSFFSHQLWFHFLETVCIFDALRSRTPSPYAQSPWWDRSLRKFGGDTYGPLLRLITLLPPLLEQSDRLTSSPPNAQSFECAMELLYGVMDLVDRLNSWLDMTIRRVPNFRYEVVGNTQALPSWTIDAAAISFPNVMVARVYLLYWSSIIALHGTIAAITDVAPSFGIGARSSPWALDRSILMRKVEYQTHESAVHIRKSIEFCLRPSHGILGKGAIILALCFARLHFEGYAWEDAQYCQRVLTELGVEKDELSSHPWSLKIVPSYTVWKCRQRQYWSKQEDDLKVFSTSKMPSDIDAKAARLLIV